MADQEKVENVYVAEVVGRTVRLLDKGYNIIKEVEAHGGGEPLIFNGACVCSRWKNWRVPNSDAFWFCLNKDGKRATAHIFKESGQVEMQSADCQQP